VVEHTSCHLLIFYEVTSKMGFVVLICHDAACGVVATLSQSFGWTCPRPRVWNIRSGKTGRGRGWL